MLSMKGLPSGLKQTLQEVVEIRLWEVYLLRSRNNLYTLLSDYSIDKGPIENSQRDNERVTFRVTLYDWERTIVRILTDNAIPFEIIGKSKINVFKHISKKKIYVAEDDLDILFALNTMLEDAGYDVLLSHCGNPMMQPNLPATDLFILDKRMPDIDGIALCQHLRTQPSTKNTPVIMISASRNFAEQAKRAGVNECLEKPFEMHQLLSLVAKYTRQQTQRDPQLETYH
jgi:CheY-like chemotaxis protein